MWVNVVRMTEVSEPSLRWSLLAEDYRSEGAHAMVHLVSRVDSG